MNVKEFRPGKARPYLCGELRCCKCNDIICKAQWRKNLMPETDILMTCDTCQRADAVRCCFEKAASVLTPEDKGELNEYFEDLKYLSNKLKYMCKISSFTDQEKDTIRDLCIQVERIPSFDPFDEDID